MRGVLGLLLLWAWATSAVWADVVAASDQETLIASSPWEVFPCQCTSEPRAQECCNLRSLMVQIVRLRDGPLKLRVMDQEKGAKRQLLEVVRGDDFLGVMPTTVGGNLTTLWVGGSAIKLLVLHYAGGRVSEVFDGGAKSPPELVLSSFDSEPAILVATWESPGGRAGGSPRPIKASIYCWKGESYVNVITVLWKDRFATAVEVCGSRN